MILRVENGCFAYRGGAEVLRNVNLETASGELTAVLGPNGAGKTTLLRCLLGRLKWTAGRSFITDGDPKRISYVPQARGVTSPLSVEDMILLGRTGHMNLFGTPSEHDRETARQAAERLGIDGLLDRRCTEISGGELQMVLIARALAAEPELIVLDEPESNLDFRNQLITLDILTGLKESGICCLFNTHYPEHALTRADRTLLLPKNAEPIFGPTSEVLTEENIAAVFGVDAYIGEAGGMKCILPRKII